MRTITIVGLLCGILGVVACGGGENQPPPQTPTGGSTSSSGDPTPTDANPKTSSGGTPDTSSSSSSGGMSSSSGGATSSSGGAPAPPPMPEPTSFAEQVSAGEKLYMDHCASCHGGKGEGGGRSPKLAGAGALPVDPPKEAKQRTSKFNNANDIFDFVSKQMPPGQGGSLKDHEYWSIIAWDLKANGVSPTKKLDSSTGATVTMKKK